MISVNGPPPRLEWSQKYMVFQASESNAGVSLTLLEKFIYSSGPVLMSAG